jgi:hypothetical protein
VDLGKHVRDYLIALEKHKRLRAAMGKQYQTIVVACLEGRISGPDGFEQPLDLETFKLKVSPMRAPNRHRSSLTLLGHQCTRQNDI